MSFPNMTESFGDYELIREVGRGAVGVVYEARHRSLHRTVALKMLVAGELASEREVGRFEVEARAAARLDHPHIVKVYDVGEHAGRRFLAMQYIKGRPLSAAIRAAGMPSQTAAKIVKEVAQAIAYAHRQGVLHRDLKPANILLDADGSPHVTDFGLAKHLIQPEYSLAAKTQTGAALGTPSYMPPEQAAGQLEKVRETADVYGLGAILYELTTGYAPFLRPTPAETIMQVLKSDVFPPRRLNRSLHKDLETICLRCLEKDPAKRYQTADELADELQRFLDDRPINAKPASQLTQAWRWCRRNPTLAVSISTAMLFLVLLAAAGIGTAFYQRAMREQIADGLYVSNMEVAQTALESSNLPRALTILKQHRNDHRRGFEWFHLWERCRESLLSPSLDHASAVWGVACSPDGKQLVTGSINGELTLWELGSWRKLNSTSCGNRVTAVAFSPDGKLVAAVCGDGALRIWDLATDRPRRLEGHHDKTWSVAFSPNGKLLASADSNGEVLLWDTSTWQSQPLPTSHVVDVWGIAFSPDSSHLATGGSAGELLWWDLDSRVPRAMRDSPGSVRSVAVSPNGRLLASGHADGSISLWDTDTDTVRTYAVHEATIWSAQFNAAGTRLAFGSGNGAVGLIDVSDGKVLHSVLGHEGPIYSLAMLPDNRLATASNDQRVKIWDLDAGRPSVLAGHTDPVTAIAIRGQALASASQDGTVRLWNLRNGESEILDGPNGDEGHAGPVWDVNYLPDGRLVSVGADQSILVWDVESRSVSVPIHEAHDGTIRFAVFSADGSLMATGGDDEIVRLWSTDGFKLKTELTAHHDDVQCATFVQRGEELMLATGSDDHRVLLWDLSTMDSSEILRHGSTVWALAAAPNGKFIVSGGMDGKVQLYDIEAKRAYPLREGGLPVHAVYVPRDARTVLSAGLDQAVTIWDAETREFRASLRGHEGRIWGLCDSADERLYASSSGDATIRIWRAATAGEVSTVDW